MLMHVPDIRSYGVLSALITSAEVWAPHLHADAHVPDGRAGLLTSRTDITPSTLDGTTAPQDGRAMHGGTFLDPVNPAGDTEVGIRPPISMAPNFGPLTPKAREVSHGVTGETGQGKSLGFRSSTGVPHAGCSGSCVLDRGVNGVLNEGVSTASWWDAATYGPEPGSPTA